MVSSAREQGSSIMRWFWQREAQPKDEHPMQEIWDELEEGGSGQSNSALLTLMKSLERQLPISPLTCLPYDPALIRYDPPQGGSVIAPPPMSRVDHRLIGYKKYER